jgi:hypothetical protein
MGEWAKPADRRGWAIYVEFWLLLALLPTGLAVFAAAPALAHGGGLAADGCHNDRKNGGRHCHRAPSAGSAVQPQRLTGSVGGAYYANCDAARAAGAAPVRRGDPGYSSRLDRDGDGVGCE